MLPELGFARNLSFIRSERSYPPFSRIHCIRSPLKRAMVALEVVEGTWHSTFLYEATSRIINPRTTHMPISFNHAGCLEAYAENMAAPARIITKYVLASKRDRIVPSCSTNFDPTSESSANRKQAAANKMIIEPESQYRLSFWRLPSFTAPLLQRLEKPMPARTTIMNWEISFILECQRKESANGILPKIDSAGISFERTKRML